MNIKTEADKKLLQAIEHSLPRSSLSPNDTKPYLEIKKLAKEIFESIKSLMVNQVNVISGIDYKCEIIRHEQLEFKIEEWNGSLGNHFELNMAVPSPHFKTREELIKFYEPFNLKIINKEVE